MRLIIYIVILALLFFAPLERTDVAKLLPIEAVAVAMEENMVSLETDTGHIGTGENVAQALEDLKANTPAVVYLDTAAYLMVCMDAVSCVDDLRAYLKPTVSVCVYDSIENVKDAAKYLSVHGDLPELRDFDPDAYHAEKSKKSENNT